MDMTYKTITLSYLTCNITSLVSSLVTISIMIITILVVKLFVVSDINKRDGQCYPLSYYFGEKRGCKDTIYKNVKIENFEVKQTTMTKILNALELSSQMIFDLNEYVKLCSYNYLIQGSNLII